MVGRRKAGLVFLGRLSEALICFNRLGKRCMLPASSIGRLRGSSGLFGIAIEFRAVVRSSRSPVKPGHVFINYRGLQQQRSIFLILRLCCAFTQFHSPFEIFRRVWHQVIFWPGLAVQRSTSAQKCLSTALAAPITASSK